MTKLRQKDPNKLPEESKERLRELGIDPAGKTMEQIEAIIKRKGGSHNYEMQKRIALLRLGGGANIRKMVLDEAPRPKEKKPKKPELEERWRRNQTPLQKSRRRMGRW